MEEQSYPKIMADLPAADLVGRSTELERLVDFALGSDADGPLLAAGAPGSGVSEILKHAYDRLFSEQSSVIPFYFAFSSSGESAERAARRFLHQFLLQTVAFRRRDASILNWFPDLCELAEISLPSDGHWVDRLIHGVNQQCTNENEEAVLGALLAAPVRAAAAGARSFVMIDDCDAAAYSSDAARVLQIIRETCEGSGIPYVFAGRRRFDFEMPSASRLNIVDLTFPDASIVVEREAAKFGVAVTDETRDLLANQFAGNIDLIRYMFQAAAEQSIAFDTFLNVQKIYAHEIFGGRIRRVIDGTLDRIAPDHDLQKSIVSLLDVTSTLGSKQLSLESWLKRVALGSPEFARLISLLNIEEFIRVTDGRVEAMTSDRVLTDYVAVRFRLEVAGEPRAALFGQSVAAYLKRAPRIMAAWYRQLAALGLRDLLSGFSLQQVPPAALDYGVFADHYKGLPDEEIMTGLRADEASVHLPQIVYTASAADLYKPIGELTDIDRSAIAIGFQDGRYSDDDEIVWVAAEIDSKLEASRELAEFWCDRLEMVALMCNFPRHKLWLISPEGFTPEAMEALRERDAFGSSRRQVGFLREFIAAGVADAPAAAEEYEVVVPMNDESEMIAAHALEEIARRHNVSAKAINQIKTALLEASINASEHSLSPDRRIRQKFRVEEDRIVITISN
ncbi:MAG: hypothetical protein HOP17_07575, partial [Acidobacteria bacterium]|nr:hypothetical protein [Acidobacteriota bacterium]